MASAARVHAVENGKDTAERTLIAMGGAAPLHCSRLAEKLGIDRVIVPVGAGVGSAYGFLRAPIAYEVVRTRLMRLNDLDPQALSDMFSQMRTEAQAVVRMGAPDSKLVETREAFMRYRGQGHEITVSLPAQDYGETIAADFHRWFEEQYTRVFSRVVPGLEVEALTWTLTLSTEPQATDEKPMPEISSEAVPKGRRRFFDPGREVVVDGAVYDRSELIAGAAVHGPAIIVEMETATVVPSSFQAAVSASGHLILTRQKNSV